jgi:hypothetical protein
MTTKVTLHAKPGLHSMHIGDAHHVVGKDGRVTVPAEHVEAALSMGCSHTPIVAPADPTDRIAELEARVAALEAAVGDKKKKA